MLTFERKLVEMLNEKILTAYMLPFLKSERVRVLFPLLIKGKILRPFVTLMVVEADMYGIDDEHFKITSELLRV
jgi:hypothetical protein